MNETSDDQSNIKIKGKRGRKPGYRKYPEGYLNPKCSMSKTPRSITSYFLFCQVFESKVIVYFTLDEFYMCSQCEPHMLFIFNS